MRYLTMVRLPKEGRPENWSKNDKEEFVKNNSQLIRMAQETLKDERLSCNKIMNNLVTDLKKFAHTYADIIQ